MTLTSGWDQERGSYLNDDLTFLFGVQASGMVQTRNIKLEHLFIPHDTYFT